MDEMTDAEVVMAVASWAGAGGSAMGPRLREVSYGKIGGRLRRIADSLDKSPWISVDDRLPDLGQSVLTLDENGWNDLVYFHPDLFRENEITHWLKIPIKKKAEPSE